jgi:hypothetical protein
MKEGKGADLNSNTEATTVPNDGSNPEHVPLRPHKPLF